MIACLRAGLGLKQVDRLWVNGLTAGSLFNLFLGLFVMLSSLFSVGKGWEGLFLSLLFCFQTHLKSIRTKQIKQKLKSIPFLPSFPITHSTIPSQSNIIFNPWYAFPSSFSLVLSLLLSFPPPPLLPRFGVSSSSVRGTLSTPGGKFYLPRDVPGTWVHPKERCSVNDYWYKQTSAVI